MGSGPETATAQGPRAEYIGAMRFIASAVCLMLSTLLASGVAAAQPSFADDIEPLVAQYCTRCHGPRVTKAGLDFSAVTDAQGIRADPTNWRTAAAHIRGGFMPPAKAPQPTAAERKLLADAIEGVLRETDHGDTVTMRRLNAVEYTNTVRDLTGVRIDPKTLPPDAATYGFDNVGDGLYASPLLIERYFELAKEITREIGKSDERRQRLLPHRPDDRISAADAARKNLEPFLRAAFRRPATASEIDARVKIVADLVATGTRWDEAMDAGLQSVLLSPNFVFRPEPPPDGEAKTRPLTNHEVAVRLSYFLFSTAPDRALAEAADAGRLNTADAVAAQASRMLTHPSSRALADNFASQWLGYREIRDKAVDYRRFLWIDEHLRNSMYEESARTFDAIVREGRPVTELIDSDTIFVNQRLAKLYGIQGIRGPKMRRVPAGEDRRRGGLLGMASILTVTSYPLRTSPVIRGKWVLESLLGTPPAPPPPNAGSLPDDDKQKDGLTLRQRLERHRANPRCASCHATMDPLGFALENYDGVGRWRTTVHGKPVDALAELPDGTRLDGPGALKDVLVARKTEFIRTMSERLFVYAIGRPVSPADRPLIDRMVAASAADGDRFAPLVLELVRSDAFRRR